MATPDGDELDDAADLGSDRGDVASGEAWQGPPRSFKRKAPSVKSETALAISRSDLKNRIAFLERICAQAEAYRNPAIATRYARALRDAEEELILLSHLPFNR